MRRFVAVSLVFLGVVFRPLAQGTEKVTAVFLGFQSAEIPASGLEILSELVTNEIAISPGYTAVDRGNLGRLLEEQELQLSDVAKAESAGRIGGLLGAQKLLVGTIGILGNLYIISLSMIDVRTGSVERTQTEEFVGSIEDLRKPVRIASQKILGIEGIEVDQGDFINVVTDPAGVGVYVNGLFEGSSPVKVRVPKPGRYTLKLHAEGYRDWIQNVTVEDNATFFVSAKLLKEEKPVDPRIKALQDGRVPFIIYATLLAAGSSDALLYAFGYEGTRLYVGLPLVTAPLAFFGALKATERVPMNGGRALMVISSSLWGASWGLSAALAFSAIPGDGEPQAGFQPLYAGLSVGGSVLYGTIATLLTMGNQPFPASRAWLFNLGSVLGSLLGLGIPYVFEVNNPAVIWAGMLTGSLAGSATALLLTRHMTEGRNVENALGGALLEITPTSTRVGLPVVSLVPRSSAGGGVAAGVSLLSLDY